jgi:hypothetical protein
MPIDKLDNFADSASAVVQEPTPTEKGLGWREAEQVVAGQHNWLQKGQNDTVNKIIQERINTYYDDATDPEGMITTGLWSEDWGSMASGENYINGGSAKQYTDIKAYFNTDGEARLLALDMAARKIEIWDPRSDLTSNINISQDLATDMIGGDTYYPVAMCTDGTTVFVVFANDTDNTMEVNAWTISETLGTWLNPWAAEVTLNGTFAVTGAPTTRLVDIIIADSTQIATVQGNNPVTAASTVTISVLAKSDGTVNTTGSGDATTGGTWTGIARRFVSDGTNLFFGIRDATNAKIASCLISNAQTPTGITGYPVQTAGRNRIVMASGGSNFVSAYNKSSAWALNDVCIRSHLLAGTPTAIGDQITIGQDGTPITSDSYSYNSAADMCFDGLNFWVICDFSASPGSGYTLVKMDASKFLHALPNLNRQIDTMNFPVFIVAPDVVFAAAADGFLRVVFDGRDLWFNVESRTGQTATGRIYRLPVAALRS